MQVNNNSRKHSKMKQFVYDYGHDNIYRSSYIRRIEHTPGGSFLLLDINVDQLKHLWYTSGDPVVKMRCYLQRNPNSFFKRSLQNLMRYLHYLYLFHRHIHYSTKSTSLCEMTYTDDMHSKTISFCRSNDDDYIFGVGHSALPPYPDHLKSSLQLITEVMLVFEQQHTH